MLRQEIPIRYTKLRQLANDVPASLVSLAAAAGAVTLQAAVEDTFGFIGLDMELLIVEFGKKHQVDLTNFDFSGLISAEPNLSMGFGDLISLWLLVPAWLLKVTIVLLCWPFHRIWARAIWKTSLRKTLLSSLVFSPPAQVLRVGDFVASAAAGYFVKREQVRFVLI